MSMTLSDMRIVLQNKINQNGTSNVIWESNELDEYLRNGIRFIIDRGRPELFDSNLLISTALTAAGSGLYSKPANYFRFISAVIGNNYINRVYPIDVYNYLEDNDLLAGNSEVNNVYDYDSSYFLITPTTSTLTVKIKYVKELVKADFQNDTDISPLKDVANDYAIDYAFALVLMSKLYQPEIGQNLINNVIKRIV